MRYNKTCVGCGDKFYLTKIEGKKSLVYADGRAASNVSRCYTCARSKQAEYQRESPLYLEIARKKEMRRKTLPWRRLKENIRTRDDVKEKLTFNLRELKSHFEAQFRDGMTWENYGTFWVCDHIKPLYLCRQHGEPAHLLSNLRPLRYDEHLVKSLQEGEDSRKSA